MDIIAESDDFHVIIPKNKNSWVCNAHTPLVAVVESISSSDMCDDEDDRDYWLFTVGIMPRIEVMHKDFLQKARDGCGFAKDDDGNITYDDIQRYCGSIPVNINAFSIPNEHLDFEYEKCGIDIKVICKDGKAFSDEEIIKAYILPRLSAVFGLIGFVLDRQIRRIGTTGWDELNFYLKNIDPIQKAMKNITNKGSKKKKMLESLK